MSCQDKVNFAAASNSVLPPIGAGGFTVQDIVSPHFWYLVVADCGSSEGVDFDYYVEWCVTNFDHITLRCVCFL